MRIARGLYIYIHRASLLKGCLVFPQTVLTEAPMNGGSKC